MEWTKHAIWWHVYPLGFCGAPIREPDPAPAPRLRRLLDWLDYAVELGASGLLLGPIFQSQSHGYDTLDPFRIDNRLGDDFDFDALVTACKDRGLRIVLDGVFSHVGADYPDLVDVLTHGRDHPKAELFHIDWDAPTGPAPWVFEGHFSLVRLDHSSDMTVEFTRDVMEYWLARGIDGWRLDAAYSIPTDFWARVLPLVRETYPDAWFLGEVIHGDYSVFVHDSGVDSVTQYELWKAIWSSIQDGNLFELDWALTRHNEFLADFVPNTFIGNHDVTRIASMIGSDGAIVALTILATVGGIPSIYYGDEQGYTGIKEERFGGDDEVRPPFPDTPSGLSRWGDEIFRAHQALLGLRRRIPWLVSATTTALELENERYTYRTSASASGDYLDVSIDLTGSPSATITDATGEILWQFK